MPRRPSPQLQAGERQSRHDRRPEMSLGGDRPSSVKDVDAEMLQDMILTAVNLALDKSRELQEKVMGPLAGGLPH